MSVNLNYASLQENIDKIKKLSAENGLTQQQTDRYIKKISDEYADPTSSEKNIKPVMIKIRNNIKTQGLRNVSNAKIVTDPILAKAVETVEKIEIVEAIKEIKEELDKEVVSVDVVLQKQLIIGNETLEESDNKSIETKSEYSKDAYTITKSEFENLSSKTDLTPVVGDQTLKSQLQGSEYNYSQESGSQITQTNTSVLYNEADKAALMSESGQQDPQDPLRAPVTPQDITNPAIPLVPIGQEIYHKQAITIFFNDTKKPQWDPSLNSSIDAVNYSTSEAVALMDAIIAKEGPEILVLKRQSDSINELKEILQLHFSLKRQMARGPRVPTVGMSLGQLMAMYNGQQMSAQSGPMDPSADPSADPTLQGQKTGISPATQVTQPEPDLNKAWNNSKYRYGHANSGPRKTQLDEQIYEATRIKLYPEVGTPLESRLRVQDLKFNFSEEENDC